MHNIRLKPIVFLYKLTLKLQTSNSQYFHSINHRL